MRWRGNSSRVEVVPSRWSCLYALIVVLLGSCCFVALMAAMLYTMGSG